MATIEGDKALGRGQFRARLYAVLEATVRTHSRGDRKIPLDTGMATVWEDAGHLPGLLFLRQIRRRDQAWMVLDAGCGTMYDGHARAHFELVGLYE